MEKVRPWCGQPSDRGRLRNRTEPYRPVSATFARPSDQRVWFPLRDFLLVFSVVTTATKCTICALEAWNGRTDRPDWRVAALRNASQWRILRICYHGPVNRAKSREALAWSLRSSSAPPLHVPIRRTSFGKRSFSTAAPSVWNSLPVSVQNCDTLTSFKSRLKAHLFTSVYAS